MSVFQFTVVPFGPNSPKALCRTASYATERGIDIAQAAVVTLNGKRIAYLMGDGNGQYVLTTKHGIGTGDKQHVFDTLKSIAAPKPTVDDGFRPGKGWEGFYATNANGEVICAQCKVPMRTNPHPHSAAFKTCKRCFNY